MSGEVYAVDTNKQWLEYISDKAKNEKTECITAVVGREDYV